MWYMVYDDGGAVVPQSTRLVPPHSLTLTHSHTAALCCASSATAVMVYYIHTLILARLILFRLPHSTVSSGSPALATTGTLSRLSVVAVAS